MNDKPALPTIFHWVLTHRLRPSLLWLVPLSFLVHALGFYLFQVVYPPSISFSPPAATVTLDPIGEQSSPGSFNWLAGEDPALIASVNLSNPDVADLIGSTLYQPTFQAISTRTAELPPLIRQLETTLATHEMIRPLAVLDSYKNIDQESTAAAEIMSRQASSRLLDGQLLLVKKVPSSFGSNPLQPVQLLVAVTPELLAESIFLMQTSGDSTVDSWLTDEITSKPLPVERSGLQRIMVIPVQTADQVPDRKVQQ